jgi:hypothetical protein
MVYPLEWPAAWARTSWPQASRFGPWSLAAARDALFGELGRLGAFEVRLTTNHPLTLAGALRAGGAAGITDRGAAVYFRLHRAPCVLACDAWDRLEHNVRAIALHVGAMRGQERWGVGSLERAFSAYQALPPAGGTAAEDPWSILGLVDGTRTEALRNPARGRELVREAFRARVPKGDPGPLAQRLILARDAVLAQLDALEVS